MPSRRRARQLNPQPGWCPNVMLDELDTHSIGMAFLYKQVLKTCFNRSGPTQITAFGRLKFRYPFGELLGDQPKALFCRMQLVCPVLLV